MRITIDASAAGRRLDRFLNDQREDLSYASVQKAIRRGRVRVNGRRTKDAALRLAAGDEVEFRDELSSNHQDTRDTRNGVTEGTAKQQLGALGALVVKSAPRLNPGIPLAIIHEDERLVVLDKPAGRVVEPGKGHRDDTLLNALAARYISEMPRLGERHDWGLVHRLDREASGLLLFARDPGAHEALVAQFARREVGKEYRALVLGKVERQRGKIALPLVESRGKRKRMRPAAGEKRGALEALTRYETAERFSGATLLLVRPETGRMHQIRVHLSAIGHPVLGDDEYGSPRANEEFARGSGLTRLFLHAAFLAFRHPGSGEAVEFRSELPEELAGVLESLRS